MLLVVPSRPPISPSSDLCPSENIIKVLVFLIVSLSHDYYPKNIQSPQISSPLQTKKNSIIRLHRGPGKCIAPPTPQLHGVSPQHQQSLIAKSSKPLIYRYHVSLCADSGFYEITEFNLHTHFFYAISLGANPDEISELRQQRELARETVLAAPFFGAILASPISSTAS